MQAKLSNAVVQVSHNFTSNDNLPSTSVFINISEAFAGILPNGATEQFSLHSFDALGFSVYSEADGAVVCAYMALKFNDAVDYWVGIIDSPTAAGSRSFTNPGFTPQAVEQSLTI